MPADGEPRRRRRKSSSTSRPAALIGLRTRMLTATQGTAIMHHNFLEYRPVKGTLPGRATGVYISKNTAKVTAYSAEGLAGNAVRVPAARRCTRGRSSANTAATRTWW